MKFKKAKVEVGQFNILLVHDVGDIYVVLINPSGVVTPVRLHSAVSDKIWDQHLYPPNYSHNYPKNIEGWDKED